MRHRTLTSNRARALRKNMSEPEVLLWTRLRGRHPERPRFRRQHPFGSLILDFYCPAAGLAVEIDGSTHWDDEAHARDQARDRWLERQSVCVLRIQASQVYRDLDGATDAILLRAAELIRWRQLEPVAFPLHHSLSASLGERSPSPAAAASGEVRS